MLYLPSVVHSLASEILPLVKTIWVGFVAASFLLHFIHDRTIQDKSTISFVILHRVGLRYCILALVAASNSLIYLSNGWHYHSNYQ